MVSWHEEATKSFRGDPMRSHGFRLSRCIYEVIHNSFCNPITYCNRLTYGNISLFPPKLGALPSLRVLSIYGNKLTGSIPPELGNLASLTSLDVSRNELTGSIPSEFGMLANLQALSMHRNKLTGALPPELGNLTGLVDLWLHENELTGTIPSELVRLTSLRHLYLNRNSGLTGSIPQGFTSFRLETFWWRDTQLCAPANEAFQAWLPTIPSHRGGATCAAGGS